MFFKNLQLFKLSDHFALNAQKLSQALAQHAARPIGPSELEAVGWQAPVGHSNNEFVHAIDGQYLICLKHEKKVLPGAVIKEAVKELSIKIEQQQGFKPGRKQTQEIKEQVTLQLLPKAFSLPSVIYAWIDTKNRIFAIDSASRSKADLVVGLLAKCIEPFPLEPIHFDVAPAQAMTQWLLAGEVNEHFTVDKDYELKAFDDSQASIRYKNESVQTQTIKDNVKRGKSCSQLSMTFDDRVSFTFTDNGIFKAIKLLGALTEQDGSASNAQELFDSDFTLMANEYMRLINSIHNLLGLKQ